MAEARGDQDNAAPGNIEDPSINRIADETETVVRNFVLLRLTSHIDREATEGELELASIQPTLLDNLRDVQAELVEAETDNPYQAEMNALGRTLAEYGDEIQHKYHDTFQTMMSDLDLTHDIALERFTDIARRLFENEINWGRIIALLCFGYEIAVTFIKRGVYGIGTFLRKIIKYIVQFIVKEKIASWIVKQGGWKAFNLNQSSGSMFMGTLFAVGVICSAYFGYKYIKGSK